MKKILLSALLIFVLGTSGAFGAENFTIGTTSIGSPWQIYATVLGNIISQTFPGYTTSIQITPGPATNIQAIEAREMRIGMGTDPAAYTAWNGLGWAEGQEHRRMRALFTIPPSFIQVVALAGRDDLNNLSDLRGQRVLLQAPGTSVDVILRAYFDALGIQFTEVYVGPVQGIDLLRERRLDAHAVASPAIPSAYYVELQLTTDIKVLGLSDEDFEIVIAQHPHLNRAVIPAGTYTGQEEDVTTFMLSNFFIVDKDMPEDMIYNLVKAVYENREEFERADAFGTYVTPERSLQVAIPLHPGAIRYYKSIGLDVPERLIPE
jgi:TRAP transporter TAXI family solute receptor